MNKKVSLIMPVYNSEKYLNQAIDSILNQTYGDFELITINDGSTDSSLDILKDYASKDSRIQIFNNNGNKGLPYTRRRGLELAKGEYIALMDSDDLSYPERFAEEVKYLDENKEVSVVASNFDYLIDDNIVKIRRIYKKDNLLIENLKLKYKFMFFNPILNSSAMFRKNFIVNKQLNYREEFFVAQDYMFWVDCINKGKMHIINKKLILYRKGHENITRKSSEKKSEERKKLIDTIRTIMVRNNKFILSESEQLLFNKIFSDPYISLDYYDFIELYNVINKMRLQIDEKINYKIFSDIAKYEIARRIECSNIGFIDKVHLAGKRFKNESFIITFLSLVKVLI